MPITEDQREEECEKLKNFVTTYDTRPAALDSIQLYIHACVQDRTAYTAASIEIHGHVQCAVCGQVLESCCD